MALPEFIVLFSGNTLEGFEALDVQIRVEAALRLTEEQSNKLFSGKPVVIKRTQSKTDALKLTAELKSMGADVSVRIAKQSASTPGDPAKGASDQADSVQAQEQEQEQEQPIEPSHGFSLKPNIGFLVEPNDPPTPPTLDLSGLSAGPIGETPLAPKSSVELPALNLSGFSISGFDDEPLLEATRLEARDIEAPAFELDKPGALLPTIGSPTPIAAPDLSALSIKTGDGDLLDASEKTKVETLAIAIPEFEMDKP
jgi:hypothetical protein